MPGGVGILVPRPLADPSEVTVTLACSHTLYSHTLCPLMCPYLPHLPHKQQPKSGGGHIQHTVIAHRPAAHKQMQHCSTRTCVHPATQPGAAASRNGQGKRRAIQELANRNGRGKRRAIQELANRNGKASAGRYRREPYQPWRRNAQNSVSQPVP